MSPPRQIDREFHENIDKLLEEAKLERLRAQRRAYRARKAAERGREYRPNTHGPAPTMSAEERQARQLEYQRRYRASEKGQAMLERRRLKERKGRRPGMSDEERKRRKREAAKRYRESGKKRAVTAKYNASEKGRTYSQARTAIDRARRDGRLGFFTAEEWRLMLLVFDWHCAYCNRRGGDLQVEHVVPFARAGRHEWTNIVPACARCNRKKRDKKLSVACRLLEVSFDEVVTRIRAGHERFRLKIPRGSDWLEPDWESQ